MTKYQPLKDYLLAQATAETPMTFTDIEQIIGGRLPPAARKYRAWWSNNASNSVITHAWLEAGYKTERVDMAGETLVFRKVGVDGVHEGPARFAGAGKAGGGDVVARLQAALGGTVRAAPGVDLTQPTGEVWEAER